MITYSIPKTDSRYLFLKSDNETEMRRLTEYLNKVPQYQFLPSYSGIPKPEVHLDVHRREDGQRVYFCFSGLYLEILNWCREHGVQTTLNDDVFHRPLQHTLEEFIDIVKGWDLNLTPHDYQFECAYNILSYQQSLSEIATRAGKTLIGYMIFRYSMEYLGVKKILMIVPSITLVRQGYEDFNSYAEFFSTETVWAKGESVSSANLTIGTFQSLVKKCDKKSPKYDPHFFDGYDCVLVDEVHNAKASSIKTILSQPFMRTIKLKFGFSGTLPLKGTLESFSVQELMGGKIQDVTPRELIDGGFISDIYITQYRLQYPTLDKSKSLRNTYIRCGEYLCSSFITNDKGKKTLRPQDKRDMCMIYEKKLPYTFTQLRKKVIDVCNKEDNFLIRNNHILSYADFIIDSCKASGSNLLMLENYVSHQSSKKVELIKDIVTNNEGNGIIFFHYNEYCKYIYNILKEAFPDKTVLCMTGATTPKMRESYKKMMKERDDVILCANYGVSSTGLTLRLSWGVFAESFKSHVIVKQSAGRGLCLDPNKDKFLLYDIIDCLPTMRLSLQGKHKAKLYSQEGFKYKIEKV